MYARKSSPGLALHCGSALSFFKISLILIISLSSSTIQQREKSLFNGGLSVSLGFSPFVMEASRSSASVGNLVPLRLRFPTSNHSSSRSSCKNGKASANCLTWETKQVCTLQQWTLFGVLPFPSPDWRKSEQGEDRLLISHCPLLSSKTKDVKMNSGFCLRMFWEW